MSCEISIVCSCRNDNYGENLLERLYYFMRSIDRFTSPIELILVEWNPLDEYEPIADIISKWNDEVKFKHPIRIITVSKENHERFIKKFEYTEGYKSFQEYPSKNVGIRHAKGTYIIQTNPDIFYPLSTIKFIEHMIKSVDIQNVVSCGNPIGKRIDILEVNRFPSIINKTKEEVENGLTAMEKYVTLPFVIKQISEKARGDFMLFRKEHAFHTRAFKECPIAIHHHEQPFVDEFVKCGWTEKTINPIIIYHFDHSRLSYEKVDERMKSNPKLITMEYLQSLVNDDNWGCYDLELTTREINNNK